MHDAQPKTRKKRRWGMKNGDCLRIEDTLVFVKIPPRKRRHGRGQGLKVTLVTISMHDLVFMKPLDTASSTVDTKSD